jgi:hypothetical protein
MWSVGEVLLSTDAIGAGMPGLTAAPNVGNGRLAESGVSHEEEMRFMNEVARSASRGCCTPLRSTGARARRRTACFVDGAPSGGCCGCRLFGETLPARGTCEGVCSKQMRQATDCTQGRRRSGVSRETSIRVLVARSRYPRRRPLASCPSCSPGAQQQAPVTGQTVRASFRYHHGSAQVYAHNCSGGHVGCLGP